MSGQLQRGSEDRLLAALGRLGEQELPGRRDGAIRAQLAKRGTPIGANDLLIAATALAHDLTLVTHNLEEFSRVVGLLLEDWEA